MKVFTENKTNKSMAIVSFALLVLPIVAKALVIFGYPEYADLVKDIIAVLATIGAGTGVVGLTAKKLRGEKVFSK